MKPPAAVENEKGGNPPDSGREIFENWLNTQNFAQIVSRETISSWPSVFSSYAALLARWQKSINLVGPKTVAEIWTRHFLDSAQLAPLIPETARTLTDLGAGAGFPGLVLAILRPDLVVRLVESDARKAAFLAEAARATLGSDQAKARAVIIRARAETLDPVPQDIVTARALAPLSRLLSFAEPCLGEATICLFPKGADTAAELTEAGKDWTMTAIPHPSATDPAATILELRHVRRSDR
jgi:16S rRNA (guanine527-N7)-methyltransferase